MAKGSIISDLAISSETLIMSQGNETCSMKDLILSFDVFDTLITRIVLSPKDVFLLMQKQLRHAQPSLPESLIHSFWGARVWAEFSARRMSPAEDIGIADIYRNLGKRCGLSEEQCQCLIAIELKTEETVLVPIQGASELLAEARELGKVAFISDMYLPAAFIRRLLNKFDLIQDDDYLYVSGELGKSKRSGNLFKHVLAHLNRSHKHLIHCGDNIFSDWAVPRSLGIEIHPSINKPINNSKWGHLSARISYAVDLLYARYEMRRCLDA